MHSFSIRGSIKNNLRTLVFILLISTSVQAQTTYTWIGGSGNWNDQSKWTPIGIPNGSDIAIMNSGDVTLSEATNVGGLQLNGGSIVGDWSLTILNDLSWTDGIFQASIDTVWVRSSATFTISGSSNKGLNRVLVNESTCSWTEGNIILGGNVPGFINSSVLDIQTDAIFGENSLGKIINNGTLKKTTGDGITTISSSFVNNGSVEIQTGTLSPTRTVSGPGSYTILESAVLLNISGTHNFDGNSFSGDGTFEVSNQTAIININGKGLVFPSTITLDFSSGSFTGDSPIEIKGPFSWTGGTFQAGSDTVWVRSSATFTISGSSNKGLNRVLVNESTCSWTEGNIILGGNVPGFINSSVLDIQTDAIFGENSLGKIINNGTLKKTTGDGITTISSSFVNNGFVEIQTGTLRPTKTTTNTSTGVISGVGTFSKNSGSFINNGTFSPGLSPGVLNFTGNFKMSETAAYNIELGGTTSGTQYDRMDVSGTASLNGELNISLTNGFIPAVNDTFRILNSTGGSGIFATVNVPTGINILTSYSENGVTIKVTSVTDIENGLVLELPKGHFLKQNYPNPFNPSTNIKFSVAKTGFVRLAVYNSIGEELDVLVSGQVNAGFYEIEFDAAYLPSGIYFYRLQAGSFVETKKMVMIK